MVKVNVVNIVITAELNQKTDLEGLAVLDEILHDSEVYGGQVAYFRSPRRIKGTVSIFASGKMISVETNSEKEAVNALEHAKEFLVKKGFVGPTMLRPRNRNIVAVADLEKKIDFKEHAKKSNIIYEPEQFPSEIIKVNKPYNATVLLFASGNAIITRLKVPEHINPIIKEIESIIKR